MSAITIRSSCGVTVLVPEFVRLRGPPKRAKPADLQGFQRVARPGLEPGTPRFSVVLGPWRRRREVAHMAVVVEIMAGGAARRGRGCVGPGTSRGRRGAAPLTVAGSLGDYRTP